MADEITTRCVGMVLGMMFAYAAAVAQEDSVYRAGESDPVRPMLEGAWVPENTRDIAFEELPRVRVKHRVVNDVRNQGGKRVNQHNYLVFYRNRYWVMWSDGPGIPVTGAHRNVVPKHDQADQRVFFATSKNGVKWSRPQELTIPPDPGFGWIARGFWLRDGKLLALASRYHAPGFSGEGLQLHAFELAEESDNWRYYGLVYDNALNNFPPQKIPTGEWMMSRRDQHRNVHFLVGGTASYQTWGSFYLARYDKKSEFIAEEPCWWVLPDQRLLALFRDNKESGFLYRAFSDDNGRTWSAPRKTNFPDASSKFYGMRLRDGRYVLVSNPNPEKRDPLTISFSNDGITFHNMIYLIGGRHVDYPHLIAHKRQLLIAFAGAKQTVEVLKIKIAALDKAGRKNRTAEAAEKKKRH